jgi:UDP-N-acetylglucosamine--N-acetylmuramyl-(pentapeptide) pyrophosphoryl-undecaprenol N-acetylglucosamine transferase
MGAAYAAADLVVCRAGASTIAELTNLGKPSVLVPYPHATGDHQRHNAEALVRNKAALMVDDSRIGHQDSFRLIVSLLSDSSELARMGAECRKQGYPDAAAKLAGRIVYLAKH